MATHPAELPEPPYYTVVFTSLRTPVDEGYADTAKAMFELVAEQPGYLGADSVRGPDGLGITVAYFRDPVAGQELLRLRERPVGDDRVGTLPRPHDLGVRRPTQPVDLHQLAGLRELVVELRHEVDHHLHVIRRPLTHLLPLRRVGVD